MKSNAASVSRRQHRLTLAHGHHPRPASARATARGPIERDPPLKSPRAGADDQVSGVARESNVIRIKRALQIGPGNLSAIDCAAGHRVWDV
jgi:hypothetical protein